VLGLTGNPTIARAGNRPRLEYINDPAAVKRFQSNHARFARFSAFRCSQTLC
jgi:hypothetical protein